MCERQHLVEVVRQAFVVMTKSNMCILIQFVYIRVYIVIVVFIVVFIFILPVVFCVPAVLLSGIRLGRASLLCISIRS